MKKQIIIFLIFLSHSCFSQQRNYEIGDTLNIFTLGGLKLREEFGLSGKVITAMKMGEKVVVLNHFNYDNQYSQTIEGFSGHWIEVKFGTKTGFAFDGFLSALPVPKSDLIANDVREKTREEIELEIQYRGQEMETALVEYIKSEFEPVCEPVEYFNGADGEGFYHLTIQKISRGCTHISQHGWEGGGTELLMPNVRMSEIKNLIILLGQRSGVDENLFEELKNNLKGVSEERTYQQEILNLDMFWIKLKCYPGNYNELNWSIEFDCASS